MSEHDRLSNYQLSQSPLLARPSPTPSLGGGSPSLSLDPKLGLGGGSNPALTAALGHYTDPPAPNPFSMEIPKQAPLAITGSDFLSQKAGGFLNPWLADPMKVAGDAQREINTMPQIDPGVAQKQTILRSPTFRF